MKYAKEIRVRNIILINKQPMIILRSEVHGSSRTGCTYKWKMKNILTNSPQEHVFRGDDRFEVIILDKKKVIYSYFSNSSYVFIDKNYEQHEVEHENLGDTIHFLKNGMTCEAVLYKKKIIAIELANTVIRKIIYSEPAIKGNTSGNAFKNAKIENAIPAYELTISVPLFVNKNDFIEIDTRTFGYKKIIRNEKNL